MDIKIHFIGCRGVSMRTLMALCAAKGFNVSGSDLEIGGHNAQNVVGADLVVYTAAIPPSNEELRKARELNIPIMSRGEMLGELMDAYPDSVAIAGAHGKTTTTGMLWEMLSPYNPTVHIGGAYNKRDGKIGSGKIFISEACEYQRSFLHLKPKIAVVLNIDLDHTDCYNNLEQLESAFRQFTKAAKITIINGDQLSRADFCGGEIVSVGLNKDNDYSAGCINCDRNARFSFCVYRHGKLMGRVNLSATGAHNISNALSAIAVCDKLGLSFSQIAEGLARFKGAERRMEFLGYKNRSAVFSDYAHHHKEIATTILSARQAGFSHITAVFEPHTYSRTFSFAGELAASLSKADSVVLLPIYPAREQPIEGVSSSLIAAKLGELNKTAILLDDYAAAEKYLAQNSKGVILFMGAGSIDNLARNFIKS